MIKIELPLVEDKIFTFSTAAMAQYDFHEDYRDFNLDDMSPAMLIDSSNPEG